MKTKNENQITINKNYIKIIDVAFDDIDVLDAQFEYEKIEVKYTATFYDKNLKNYEGFYYSGSNVDPFLDVSDSDQGNEIEFVTIQDIVDLIPDAQHYHKSTTHVSIQAFVSFIDEEGKAILHMSVGRREIEV